MKAGIQLYSVRTAMQQDPLAAIRRVAEIGYRYLEVANHNADKDPGVGFAASAADIQSVLKQTGARVISAHLSPLAPKALGPALEYHAQLGTGFFVVPMAFFAERDDILRLAESLSQVAEACREYQIELLYHNHFHEFQTFGNATAFDILMDNTDPALVKIELDTYWAMRGGQDPVALLQRYGKRVRLVHQKDYPKGRDGDIDLIAEPNRTGVSVTTEYFMQHVDPTLFTEIGTGIMDIQRILDAARRHCSCKYIILEQDATQLDEMESIRVSMEHFRQFSGIAF